MAMKCTKKEKRTRKAWKVTVFSSLNMQVCNILVSVVVVESFRFEDEDEALCFHHNEILKLFRLQLGWDDKVDCNNVVTPSLSRI